jgi:hypothetical protein
MNWQFEMNRQVDATAIALERLNVERINRQRAADARAYHQQQITGREMVFQNRIFTGAEEAAVSLDNIMGLRISASMGLGQGNFNGNLMEAPLAALRNKLTPEADRAYQQETAGLARALSAIEAQGLAPGAAFQENLNRIFSQAGDTGYNKLIGLAEAKQIIVQGMKPTINTGRYPPDMVAYAQRLIDQVNRAIPWTVQDVNRLMAQEDTNPAMTMGQFAASKGLTTQLQTPGSAPGASPLESEQPAQSDPNAQQGTRANPFPAPTDDKGPPGVYWSRPSSPDQAPVPMRKNPDGTWGPA